MLIGVANQELGGWTKRFRQQCTDWLAECSERVHVLWPGICQHMQVAPFHPCIVMAQQPTKGGSLVIWAGLARKAECD